MCGQETLYAFTVPVQPIGDHWQAVSLSEWLAADPPADGDWKEELRWKREFYPEMEDVVNDLHTKGLIEAGDYALHVWW